MVGAALMDHSITYWQMKHMWVFWLFFVVNIGCQCALICSDTLGRIVPTNYVLLGIVTFTEGYMVSMICAKYNPMTVFQVFLLTCCAFGGLTAYAITTKRDFTDICGSICMSLMFGVSAMMMGLSIILMFTHSPVLRLILAILGLTMALVYVVYDTQLIIGSGKYSIDSEDYIKGALVLYIDFINIFLNLLAIMGAD
jgi:FtsH-binding integral membrane protein